MTEADTLAYLDERSVVRRCLQQATMIEIMEAYLIAEYDPWTRAFIFPGGLRMSELEVTKHERYWIALALDLEVPYGPFEA